MSRSCLTSGYPSATTYTQSCPVVRTILLTRAFKAVSGSKRDTVLACVSVWFIVIF